MVKNDITLDMSPPEKEVFLTKAVLSKTVNVFDYQKAIKIIRENKIRNAKFGLDGDWKDSSDYCLKDGKAVNGPEAYLNSPWGIPTLVDMDTGKEYPCYTVEDKDTFITRIGWNKEEMEELNAKDYQIKLI